MCEVSEKSCKGCRSYKRCKVNSPGLQAREWITMTPGLQAREWIMTTPGLQARAIAISYGSYCGKPSVLIRLNRVMKQLISVLVSTGLSLLSL